MKKITLFFIMLGFFLTASAQYNFNPIVGPTNVASGSPVTINLNDAANLVGVPVSSTGSYDSFSITVDWVVGVGNPWSTEADLTITTTAGSITIDPPTTGGLNNNDSTTLTFVGDLAGIYDTTTDGYIDLVLNQSYVGSDADWGNIVVTLFESPTCVPPAGMASSNATTTSIDLIWTAGDSETTWNLEWNAAADFTPGNGEEEGSVTVNTTPATALTGLTPFTDYFLYYQADCSGNGLSEWVGPFNFLTGYCESIPSSNDGDGISQVQLGTETFTSAGDVVFEDFTSPTVDLAAGVTANFQITFATGYTYGVNVWIDLNNDLVYDNATELVFQGETTNANPTTFDASFVMPNVPLGIYNMRIGSADSGQATPNPCYNGAWGVTIDMTVNVTSPPDCIPASSLSVTNLTDTSADLEWVDLGGTGVTWDLEWGPEGFTAGTGTLVTGITTTSYPLTGLNPGTAYDYYVLTNCASSASTNTGPFSFITGVDGGDTCANAYEMTVETDCDTASSITFNFANSFDLAANGENPSCDGFGNFGYWFSFVAPTVGSVIINFGGAAAGVGLEVLDACNGTAVFDCNNNDLNTGDDTGLIGGLTPGNTYVAVIWRDVQSGTADICIEEGPSCPEPIDLISDVLSTTSVEVGWTENGTATAWNIEYGDAAFVQGTGTLVNGITTNTYTIDNLTSLIPYEFYVQANCGTGVSIWAGPFAFIIDYCESIPTSNDGQGVDNVTIGITNFPSLGDVTYENQTTPVVNVFRGLNTDLAITFATGFTYFTNIWIDLNDDLNFDATELVFQGVSAGANPTTLDASFTMPATAALGEHRMRIGTADTGQETPNPCYNGTWGVTLDFTVNIQELNCTLAEADFAINTDCDNDQFFVDVNVTNFGDATSLEISNNLDTTTIQGLATDTDPSYQAGPFPFGSTVRIFVTNEQDNDCVISSPVYEVLACPPVNDSPCEAIVAVVNDDFLCVESTPGTLLAATDSGVPSGTCGGDTDDDVWFQFVAQNEFQLISLANFPQFENIDHALYSGTCDALVELDCEGAEYSTVTPSLIVGDTYFVRVFSGGSAPESINFDLCITPYAVPLNNTCLEAAPYCSGSDADDILYSFNTVDELPGMGQIDCLFTTPNPTYNLLAIGSSGDILIEMVQNTAFDADGNPIGFGLDVDFILWGPYSPDDTFCDSLLTDPVVDCSYSAAPVENVTLLGAQEGDIYILLITNFAQDAGIIQVTQTNLGEDGSGVIVADITVEITTNDIILADTDGDPLTTDVEGSACGFGITLQADSPLADTFVWEKDGSVIPGETSATLAVTESATYQVEATNDACGANAFSQLVFINIYDESPPVEDQTIALCDGPEADGTENFDLNDYTTSLGLGTDFTVRYFLSASDAGQQIGALNSPHPSSGQTLILRIEDTDAFNNGFANCAIFPDLELVVNPRPIINQPVLFAVCDDEDGIVDGITDFDLNSIDDEVNTDTDVEITYHTSQDNADNAIDPLPSTYSSSGETIYVRAVNTVTNCYETTSFVIEVNIVPLATFDPIYDYEVCPNATVPVEIGLIPTNFTADQVSISWYLDNTIIGGQTGLILSTVLVQGEYRAVIEFNDSGCVNDTVTTTVIELESCVIPQGISPDASPGLNDTFDLSSYDVTKLEIFNRNGTLVYSKTNYTNEWIGQTDDGEELPVGTYFYVMEYEGGTKKRSAWIYLNR